MGGRRAALRFLLSSLGAAGPLARPDDTTRFDTPSGPIDADLYHGGGPTVLALPGMGLRGYRDPRMGTLARRLAATGLEVVVPCIREIEDLEIHPAAIERMADLMVAAAARAGGPVGGFGISFAGSLALVAATRPRAAGAVSTLCLLGSFDEADAALRFAMVAPNADPYARLVLLRQHLPRFAPGLTGGAALSPAAIRALEAMLEDNGLVRAEPRHPARLAALDAAERDLLDRAVHDPATRAALYDALLTIDADGVAAMSAIAAAPAVRFPVLLLHGSGDNVIPAAASTRLAAALAAANVDVRLRITKLLGHGDVAHGPAILWEFLGLWADLAWWFDGLRVGPRRPS